MTPYPVHLVCSSGGVKCFSYIGAIQKLVEKGFSIASVSACSMGSIIGAMLCSGMDPDKMEETIKDFPFSLIRKKFFSMAHMYWYPFSGYKKIDYAAILNHLTGKDLPLGEMKIPISVAALDIRQRTLLAYSTSSHPEMKISDVISIATAIPPLSPPFKKDKRILVDAAVASESPVWMAANYQEKYPIIVLKPSFSPDKKYLKTLPKFLGTLFNSSAASHDKFVASDTPRVIEVEINCGDVKIEDFRISRDRIETLIMQGQLAMETRINDFDGNFNNTLHIEEIKSSSDLPDTTERAIAAANSMMNKYRDDMGNRNQVFISYSRRDATWLSRLQVFMKSLERFSGIKIWDDTNIKPGAEWNKEIQRALSSTKVAVFLVTENFLASDFIQDQEMKYFLTTSKIERVPILWVAVSACNYRTTPLKDIQSANNPARPLDQLTEAEQNVEFVNICQKIIDAMK